MLKHRPLDWMGLSFGLQELQKQSLDEILKPVLEGQGGERIQSLQRYLKVGCKALDCGEEVVPDALSRWQGCAL